MHTVSIQKQKPGEVVTAGVIEEVIRAIADNFSPHKIILFGSYATGHPTADSDLDFLIIMDSNLPRHKRAVPLYMLFRPIPCAIDFLVYTPAEVAKWEGTTNHIITAVLKMGKVLYERQ